MPSSFYVMEYTIPFNVVPIEDSGYHLMVEVLINSVPAIFLIDTGASKSIMDQNRIVRFISNAVFTPNEQLSAGLGTNTMESQLCVIDSVEIGGIKIPDYQTVLMDISHVNESYQKLGYPGIDGVLGSDLLYRFKASIDYEKSSLLLKTD